MTQSKKKILIFSLVYYPEFVGGAEVAVKEITDRLGSEFEFHMVTLHTPNNLPTDEQVGSVSVHRIMGSMPFVLAKLLFPFGAFLKARSLHATHAFDSIWSIMANRAGFAALFFKFFNPKIYFLLTLQEGDETSYPLMRMGVLSPVLKPVWKRIFKKADHIQTISNYLSDWAKQMGATAPITVIPNGVDTKKFSERSSIEDIRKLRQEFGITPEERLLITTSRLVEKNAVGDVIAALEFLPTDVKFMILGTGILENDLRKQVEEMKVGNRVLFLGFVPNEKLPLYLQASDIFIRPSLSEGMGISFIEAMAAGTPVIATNVGGIPDFLKDKETGIFCSVKDPKDIARKVTILLRDQEIRNYIIQNAQKLVVEKYDWSLVAGKIKSKFL
jgi:glycosyltransferase involved in cell wall biosynthesis